MSRQTKWLLLALLVVILHSIYMAAQVGACPGGGITCHYFPWGFLNAERAGTFLIRELWFAGALLVFFGLSLFDDERRVGSG